LFGVILGGAVSDRLAPDGSSEAGAAGAGAAGGFAFFTFLGRASTEVVVYSALAGFGFFRGLYDSIYLPGFSR